MFNNAKWIYHKTDTNEQYERQGAPSPFFRKCFTAKKLKKAEISITSLGIFKAYLNGEELDSDMLLPGWTDYNKTLHYYTFDITDRIRKNNCIGIILGDGWYAGNIAWFGRNKYGGYPLKLLAEITLDYGKGNTQTIVSDNTWQAECGHIIYADILDGEFHDGRKNLGSFSSIKYDCNWQNANVFNGINIIPQPSPCPPTCLNKELSAVKISQRGESVIYDCGQNFAGIINAVIKGEQGAELRFRYAEMLYPDGGFYTENLRTARATDYYICSGKGIEIFNPVFTYHGFRYVEVTVTGKAEIIGLKGLALYNRLEETGSFSCSNDIVNKVYRNAFWSQRSNFISVPTDCPQRDERLGWTGDAEIFCGSAMYNMDCSEFFEKYLADVRDAQSEDGMVDCVAPSVKRDFDNVKGAAAWGDAITIIPYTHYVMYGDKQIIIQNIDSAKKWVQYCRNTSDNLICPSKGYGDWLNVNDESDKSVLATAFFAYSALLTAKMCGILSDSEAALYYKLYEEIKAAFLLNFVSGDYSIKSDTQTCYLIACSFGLLNLQQAKPHLLRTLERKNNRLATGFIGIKFLLPVLCEMGESGIAYNLITMTQYPSWGYSVVNGATTIWERWNSYTNENGFADVRMNSFNHYSLGSCVEWMYKYVLGIMPYEKYAGFKKVLFRPFIDKTDKITSAQGSYKSVNGKITAEWEKHDGYYIYKAEKPHNIEAEYEFNGFEIVQQNVAGNRHNFVLKEID